MTSIRAVAHTNIALIKYWGKKPGEGNLPAMGSLSLTLDQFYTDTLVTPSDRDSFALDGRPADSERVFAHAEFFRKLSGKDLKVRIESQNHVPTGSGLASSASGFAALTIALAKAFDISASTQELSRLARRGSGSAARSIFGGFVRMHGGPNVDDQGAFAEPLETTLDVRMVVLECAQTPKAISSREAMKQVAASSIFYESFVANHPRTLSEAVTALKAGDLEKLGGLMEQSTMQMHATMLGCEKPFWYFNAATFAALNEVRALRQRGHACYFTMDAGPHVKVLCPANESSAIAEVLTQVEGVSKVTVCAAGPGAHLS